MKACRVTVTTVADGKETSIAREGKMRLTQTSATVVYREENAEVTLAFEKSAVTIERVGDYTLRLLLKKGEICDGAIGLNGSEGGIKTQTSRLAYTLSENSFMLSVHYDLLLGDEPQNMRIRLFAKEI